MICIDGFFDAGMLQLALKAQKEAKEKPSEKAKHAVGKKLRLSEY